MGYFRKKEDINRLIKIYKNKRNNYMSGVWFDASTNRYIRYYRIKAIRKIARSANKAIRHCKDIPNGRAYRYIKADVRFEAF